jgi:uncharacterized protein YjbJ (UPF0337 family)
MNHVIICRNCVTHPDGNNTTFAGSKISILTKVNLKSGKMNKELMDSWSEQKAKLKKKFAALTDNDSMFDEGRKDEILGKLQMKLGKSKEELQKILGAL